jgi:hypothetical protein
MWGSPAFSTCCPSGSLAHRPFYYTRLARVPSNPSLRPQGRTHTHTPPPHGTRTHTRAAPRKWHRLHVPAENFPFCTIDPNVAIVPVPDKRFDWLCVKYKPASEVTHHFYPPPVPFHLTKTMCTTLHRLNFVLGVRSLPPSPSPTSPGWSRAPRRARGWATPSSRTSRWVMWSAPACPACCVTCTSGTRGRRLVRVRDAWGLEGVWRDHAVTST